MRITSWIRRLARGGLYAALPLVLWNAGARSSAGADLEQATSLYQQTKYREALRLLETGSPAVGPADALIGKCYYMLEDYKKATEFLQKAVAAEPSNSGYFNWLGKAFGKRAETSSFLTAPSYASKARTSSSSFFLRPSDISIPRPLD